MEWIIETNDQPLRSGNETALKLLLIIPYIPTPIRIRPYSILRFLARAGHEVHLATVWHDEEEHEQIKSLAPYCQRIEAVQRSRKASLLSCLAAMPGAEPLQSVYSFSRDLMAKIEGMIVGETGWDAIHVEHLRGSRYGTQILDKLKSRRIPIPVVWDSVDCISSLFEQAAQHQSNLTGQMRTMVELPRTRVYEARMCRAFDQILVTSRVDKANLEDLCESHPGDADPAPIHVLANGVDTGYFQPGDNHRSANTIVFSGKMSYHANVAAVRHLVRSVMPHVWKKRPDVRLQVVGKDPTPEVRQFAEETGGKVEVTGTVPEILPYLQRAAAAVVPTVYGAGIQNKVLEAMACAAPVVSSPGAVSALDCSDGVELLVREEPAAFAGAILSLLDDPQKAEVIGDAGQRYVAEHHAWPAVIRQLEDIYSQPPRWMPAR